MTELLPPQRPPAPPVTAQELRVAAAAERGHTPLVLVPAVVGNAQTAKSMESKTAPVEAAVSAGQDRAGNAAVAGAAMRMIPMALPKAETHPGR
ncbi:hypothetical protein [Amycolatopsis vancoresmycina]|uniref:Uncharacterized protein n=1 Tax=Amycolatopsis vancoresmycina DSM 44592 TaxID=1292037 RepID=R1GCA5_9PSEU|nr:hypothetical protein [Amycolatopsis vancoresmycina]EOD68972.1 hypothetical protein H480_08593 [Amycolatopsis vancoresmycina DSM 44592]